MAVQMLDLAVVAEGVERREEVETLHDMGINLFQGYYFARPRRDQLLRDDQINW